MKDKGNILKPVKGDNLEVYVDADFDKNQVSKKCTDRDTDRSRHG